jgi:methyl halide transferase
MTDADPPPLVLRLRSLVGNGLDQSSWSAAWAQGITPWDSGGTPQQALVSFMTKIDQGKDLVARQVENGGKAKALVPGCGTGYDVEYLASVGYETIGIDIAPEATKASNKWLESLQPGPPHLKNIHFRTADYFVSNQEQETYDLIYDYTFFCALPEQLRSSWAEAHATSCKKGTGRLLTIVYPIMEDRPGGPPVSPSRRDSLLSVA